MDNIDRFLRDGIPALQPFHPSQHEFQAGKSVETSLHQLVARVEEQEIDLGFSFDIEVTFNNTSYDSMCAALGRHEVDLTIVRWVRATLK